MKVIPSDDITHTEHRLDTGEQIALLACLAILWYASVVDESPFLEQMRPFLYIALFILLLLFGAEGVSYVKG
jgi:hypothetical protein